LMLAEDYQGFIAILGDIFHSFDLGMDSAEQK